MCARLRELGTSYDGLDAGPWLAELEGIPDSDRFSAPRDELPAQPGHPWRRRFARGLDLSLYTALYRIFRQLVLHIPIPVQEEVAKTAASHDSEFSELFSDVAQLLPQNAFRDFFTTENLIAVSVPFLLMLLLEPILLHFWGTTPGKFLFGMRLRDSEGEKLSLADAFYRTWGAIFWGLGLDIPYFGFWRLYRSYYIVTDMKERNRWEYVHSTGQPEQYVIPDKGIYCVPFALLLLMPFVWNLAVSMGGALPPNRYAEFPHRNLLTEEEFLENYQYYLTRYYSDRLDELEAYPGEWTPIYTDPNGAHVQSMVQNEAGEWELVTTLNVSVPSAFQYTLRAPVSFYQGYHYPGTYEMATTAGLLAYAGAMPGESLATFRPHKMMNTLTDQDLNYGFLFQMSSTGSLGKWYENSGGVKITVWDSKVYVSQRVIREATGETVYSPYDIADTDEWLLLTFTVSNKTITG